MKRDLLLDYLKLLAILAVVMIHLPGTEQVRGWIFPLNPNATFAVLSGMFVFSNASFVEWLKKRWHRLVVPYLIWETIYILVGVGFDLVSHKFVAPSAHDLFQWIFFGGASVQLWFVTTLFYAQLLLWGVSYVCKRWASSLVLNAILICIALGGICYYKQMPDENLSHMAFMFGYCSLGALVRIPYERLIGKRFVSDRWGGVCKYTMGVYLCHFLLTRIVSMLYPRLLGLMPQVVAVVGETILAFGASMLLVHLTHKRFYWLWGMKK